MKKNCEFDRHFFFFNFCYRDNFYGLKLARALSDDFCFPLDWKSKHQKTRAKF